MFYINLTGEDYYIISKILENEQKFPNLIFTIENNDLSELELMEIYESINHPIYIGMNLANAINFEKTNKESSLR